MSTKHTHLTARYISLFKQQGKVGWILLWLLGIPVPILLFLYLIRGCT